MKQLALAVGVAMFTFGGTGAQEKYSELFQKDFDGLQGGWEVTEFVVGGEDRLVRTGEEKKKNSHKNRVDFLRAQVNLPNDERVFSFNLDPTKASKHIDLLGQIELGKGEQISLQGIYELKDDTLKVCVRSPRETKAASAPRFDRRLVRTDRMKRSARFCAGGGRNRSARPGPRLALVAHLWFEVSRVAGRAGELLFSDTGSNFRTVPRLSCGAQTAA